MKVEGRRNEAKIKVKVEKKQHGAWGTEQGAKENFV